MESRSRGVNSGSAAWSIPVAVFDVGVRKSARGDRYRAKDERNEERREREGRVTVMKTDGGWATTSAPAGWVLSPSPPSLVLWLDSIDSVISISPHIMSAF